MKTRIICFSTWLVFVGLLFFSSCKKDPCADGVCSQFQGCVTDQDGKPIPGADVSIKSASVKTDEKGCYAISFDEEKPAGDYVITIRKEKFATASQVAFGPGKGRQHILYPASVFDVDPTKPIDLTDTESTKRKGSFSAQADWSANPLGQVPMVYKNGKLVSLDFTPEMSNAFEYSKSRKQAGSGIRVSIPANSISTSGGTAPSGNVSVSLSTIDLFSFDAMPGDFTVSPEGQQQGRYMISYGAGAIEIYDSKNRYNLKKGSKAKIAIPVDPAHLALKDSIPENIPIFYFNEETGKWISDGMAKLSPTGDIYIGELSHFSTFNMDVEKTNPACFAFRYNSVGASTFPTYKVEVLVPNGGMTIQRQATVIDQGNYPDKCLQDGNNTGLHMLYNLPADQDICMIMLDTNNNPINIMVEKTGATYGAVKPSCTTPDCITCNPTQDQCDDEAGPCAAYTGCGRHYFQKPSGDFIVAAEGISSTSVKVKWVYVGSVASPTFTVWEADDSMGLCADVALKMVTVTSLPLTTNPAIKVFEATVTGLASGNHWFKIKESGGAESGCSDTVTL
jgi:Carboxypeptidase regulatory-like domain